LRDELVAEVLPEGLVVEVSGAGAEEVPRDASHLVVRSMHAAFDLMGVRPPGLRLECHNVIPHARGLGSSSAAIVGGLVLARALVDGGADRLPDADLLDLAVRLEGHPDNVAPALLGGFVISGTDERGEVYAVPSPVLADIAAEVFVPPDPVSTELARGLLPDVVPHADAATDVERRNPGERAHDGCLQPHAPCGPALTTPGHGRSGTRCCRAAAIATQRPTRHPP